MNTPNFANQTIWTSDNLFILRGMNSECVDLIYLDPPFNSKANYAAPIGSEAAGAEFKDTWALSDIDVEWINLIEAKHPALYRILLATMTSNDKSYLVYMAARLLEMHRILKPTGSIYLHCDPTMSHYLKLLMDAIFGRDKFLNEVIWHYGKWTNASKFFQRNHDVIFFYSKNKDYSFNKLFQEFSQKTAIAKYNRKVDDRGVSVQDKDSPVDVTKKKEKGVAMHDVWNIPFIHPMSKERTGYPTQKPLDLLRRIITASSNDGDLVLDPFCGCATACIAAELEERQWIGIDISPKAADLVKQRMKKEVGLFYKGAHRTDIPQRTDMGKLPPPRSHAKTLYGAQAGNCAGCNEHFELRHFEVDHIIAQKKGGTDHIENLQLLCGNCNRIKGDRGMEYLKWKLQMF